MPLKWLVCILALAGMQCSPLAWAAEEDSRPNIVLIFVDDLGYGDLSCYGNELIETPNLDRMAAAGQRWTSFYAAGSTCVPSRTGLMTGRHPSFVRGGELRRLRAQLMPACLHDAGYQTAILGKWHLAGYPKDFAASEMHPLECGFNYHFGTPGSNDVPAPPGRVQNRALFDECNHLTFQVPLFRGRHRVELPVNQKQLTQRYTEEAKGWIREHRDERFFLYLAHNMPHAPVFASDEFENKSAGGRFGDVVEEIDWSVGQVLETLAECQIEDETLVVFTSDNGPWTMFEVHAGTAKPLRGEKGTSWEGGFRVPTIFYWPGKVEPAEIHDIGANVDLHATFLELAGEDAPSDSSAYISSSLASTLLTGESSPRKEWLYGNSAFRHEDYKIHLTSKVRSSNPDTRKREPIARHDPPLLFNLSNDISEQHDMAAEHPDLVADLLERMRNFQQLGKRERAAN